jgi:hypothetical protein
MAQEVVFIGSINPPFCSQAFATPLFFSPPVYRVPVEVLSMIFQHGTKGDPYSFPTLVSHVCSWWRDAAIRTPRLWKSVKFTDQKSFERACTWLNRSRGCPLEIDIGPLDWDPPQLFPDIISLILNHVGRWERLAIFPPVCDYIYYFFDQWLTNASPALLLRDLEIVIDEELVSEGHIPMSPMLFPQLSTLALYGCPTDRVSMTFMQLQRLELNPFGLFDGVYATLSQLAEATLLQSLTVEGFWPHPGDDDETSHLPAILLPALHQLHFVDMEPHCGHLVLRSVHCPSLKQLWIASECGSSDCHELLQSLSESPLQFPALTDLFIEGYALDAAAMVNSLSRLPEIRSLSFKRSAILDKFLILMDHFVSTISATPASIICSQLQKLHLTSCDGFASHALFDFVASRCIKDLKISRCTSLVLPNHILWFQEHIPRFAYQSTHLGLTL